MAARLPTRHRHWRRVDSRAAADEGGRTSGSGPSSSSLPSYAGGEGHRHLQQRKQRTTTVDFNSLLCRSASLFASRFSFRFPLFSVSSGRRCDHRAAGLWVLSGLQLLVAGESVDGAVQEELEEDGGQIQVCERRCVRAGLEEAGGGGGLLLWRSSLLNGLHPCRW